MAIDLLSFSYQLRQPSYYGKDGQLLGTTDETGAVRNDQGAVKYYIRDLQLLSASGLTAGYLVQNGDDWEVFEEEDPNKRDSEGPKKLYVLRRS
ncbi:MULTISPECIES: hypothetical protein [Pseudomonas]|uniref:hypothetical protein n=1 Tax=Pseudomonas TaxID=286 RepID=UPI00257CB9AC|nr:MULTISPECIES: hypothetical protein [Pseudomonas]